MFAVHSLIPPNDDEYVHKLNAHFIVCIYITMTVIEWFSDTHIFLLKYVCNLNGIEKIFDNSGILIAYMIYSRIKHYHIDTKTLFYSKKRFENVMNNLKMNTFDDLTILFQPFSNISTIKSLKEKNNKKYKLMKNNNDQ